MKHVFMIVALLVLGGGLAVAGGQEDASAAAAAPAAAASGAGGYLEAPMLAERVAAGELPPVNERLPENPLVLTRERSAAPDGLLDELKIGQYGGTVRLVNLAPNFAPEMYFMTIETLLARPGWISMEHPLTGNIFESYEISPDKTTFTFQMRRGMRWSDGEPLTTEDVAFYHEDILHNELLTPNIGSRYRSGLAPTGDVYQFEVIDDYSWRITFSEATPGFLDEVNKPWLDYTVFIQPKHYLAQFHADYADADELDKKVAAADLLADEWPRLFNLKMLTPWEGKTPDVVDIPVLHPWVVTSSSPTQTIFERNPYYFKVDAAGNQLPYIDGIVSTKVEGSEGANLKIIAGEVDLADELAKISSLPLYRENEGNGYRALGSGVPYNPVVHAFNFAYEDPLWRELAGDLRFRQALNLAINRDEIIDAVYYGFASPPVWVPSEFNLEEANRLLDEVGLDQRDNDGWRLGPDGERFEINLEVAAHLPDTVPANELIAEHYKAAGIFTTLKVVEIGLLFEHRNANQLQIDTVWNEATTMHAFGHARSHLIHHIPPWNQWYNTGGTAGEEPPDWFQELYELGIGIGPGIPWDQEIVDRYQQTFYDTIPHINVTYNPGADRLDNVFTEGVAQWVTTAPSSSSSGVDAGFDAQAATGAGGA